MLLGYPYSKWNSLTWSNCIDISRSCRLSCVDNYVSCWCWSLWCWCFDFDSWDDSRRIFNEWDQKKISSCRHKSDTVAYIGSYTRVPKSGDSLKTKVIWTMCHSSRTEAFYKDVVCGVMQMSRTSLISSDAFTKHTCWLNTTICFITDTESFYKENHTWITS